MQHDLNLVLGSRMRRGMGLIVALISLSAIMACFVGYSFFYASGYEILMVTGESMRPTLNKGDLVIVETGYRVGQVYATYWTGDIICFHKPHDPDELITHRAVETRRESNFSFLITKGDNNNGVDSWHISDNELVGKVVALNSPFAWIYVTSLMWIAVIAVFVIVSVVVYVRIVAGRNKEERMARYLAPLNDENTSTTVFLARAQLKIVGKVPF